MPTIQEYGTTNVLSEPLAAAAQRRARRIGGVLAGARLQRFRTVGDAALFLAGSTDLRPHRCIRIGRQGAAPSGSALRGVEEVPESWVAGSRAGTERPTEAARQDDLDTLAESPDGLEAMEWIDASSVPLAFTGVSTGCQVVVLWR